MLVPCNLAFPFLSDSLKRYLAERVFSGEKCTSSREESREGIKAAKMRQRNGKLLKAGIIQCHRIR